MASARTRYVQRGEDLFENEDEEFICKITGTIEEAIKLIEARFSACERVKMKYQT